MPSEFPSGDPSVEELRHELAQGRRRETASAEILRIIGAVPTNIQPVFDTIARNAAQLCNGLFTSLVQFDGELLHCVATNTTASAEVVKEIQQLYPMAPTRFHGAGRAILDRTIVHIPDVELDATYRHQSLARAIGMRSGIWVPMLRGVTPVGVIAVGRAEPGPFPTNEMSS
jgi:two-component system, NtrC family, sensor kinase